MYLPGSDHVGISQRIEDEDEKQRLKQCIESYLAQPAGLQDTSKLTESEFTKEGVIVRTVAEGVSEQSLQQDVDFLRRLWRQVSQQIAVGKAPQIIYQDLPLALRTLRDIAHPQIEKIRIDSKETYQKATEFIDQLVPDMAPN